MTAVLGLDISTTCTGICVLDAPVGKPLLLDYVRLTSKKLPTMFDKASLMRSRLRELQESYQVSTIVIEKAAERMGRGMSSAHTICTLQRFNGIVAWLTYDIFGIIPAFVDPRVARKRVGINVPRGADAKQCVVKYLQAKRGFDVELTRAGNIAPACFDMADAYVVALSLR